MDFLIGIFDYFIKLFQSNPWTAVFAAFMWGVFSIIFSPCHVSAIPLAVGYINGKGRIKQSRALILSLLFALGILVTISVIGLITGFLGRMLGDIGKIGAIIVAVIFILIGIWLMDVIPVPQLQILNPAMKGKGALGAFLLGLIFGLALGPCSFGFMMPLLVVVFRVAHDHKLFSIMLLASFALGHAGVIVFAGTFINWVQKYLNWSERSKGTMVFRRICGILVILTGFYLILVSVK